MHDDKDFENFVLIRGKKRVMMHDLTQKLFFFI